MNYEGMKKKQKQTNLPMSSRSRSRKSPVKIPIRRIDALGSFGYHDIKHKSALARHRALNAAVRSKGALDVIRRLSALATVTKNTQPTLSRKIRADQRYVSRRRSKS